MEEFYLAVVSRFNHQEGYLDLALKDMIDAGLASQGFDGNKPKLITILYDSHSNPYLLFTRGSGKEVKTELMKRIIRPEGVFEVSGICSLENCLNSNIHRLIQERNGQSLHTISED